MTKLSVGQMAPHFRAPNQNDKIVSLSDFENQKLILFFYPKDDTPGCTAEACDLSQNYDYWQQKGYNIVGVSTDDAKSHQKFIQKHNLNMQLLVDANAVIATNYGVWGEKKNYGKTYMGILRTTFVINENGLITHIIDAVDTKASSEQLKKILGTS